MRVCSICNRKTDTKTKIIKCDRISCHYWVHKNCLVKRKNSDVNNWACRDHTLDLEDYFNSALHLSDNMSHNNKTNNEIESMKDITEQNAGSTNTFQEFNNNPPPGSTPTNQNSEIVNIDQEEEPQEDDNIQPNIILCCVCRLQIKDFVYTCKGCSKKCHPFCLHDREESTLNKQEESFVCNQCVDALILKAFSNTNSTNNNEKSYHERNHAKSNNGAKSTITPTTSRVIINTNNNNYRKNEDDSSDEEEDRTTRRAETSHSGILTSNSNLTSNKTISSEHFFFKLQLKKLPEVVDADISWNVFYSSFMDTKDLFTDYENVTRVQNAIKDDTVKRIGGKGLFNLKTYAKCIENVNIRLKHNMNFLTNEAHDIENFRKIKPDEKVRLVEFIDKVRNFCTIAEAYDDKSYLTNRRFLANICDVVPNYLRNKWESKQAKLETSYETPSLLHMIDIFDKELPRIEASIRNDKIRSTDKKSETTKPKLIKKPLRFLNINTENKTNINSSPNQITVGKYGNNNESNFMCWFHKSNDHAGNRCKNLWELDGKTVSNLAKANKICTFCGQRQHKPCPYSAKLKCKVEGCSYFHHSLFCYKRKGKINSTHTNNNENANSMNNTKASEKIEEPKNKMATRQTSNNNKIEQNSDSEAEIQEMIRRFTNLKDCSNSTNSPKQNNTVKVLNGQSLTNNNNSCVDKTLLSVVVIELENKKNAAFLLDSGSTVSLIEEDIANELNLNGPWYPLTLLWSGELTRKEKLSRIVKVKATSLNNTKECHSLYFRTVKDLKVCDQTFKANEIYEEYPQFNSLKLCDFEKISGVIGIDNLFAFERNQTIKALGKHGHDYHGVKSPLGDYVYGTKEPLNVLYNNLNSNNLFWKANRQFVHVLSEEEQKEFKTMEEEVMGLEYHQPNINDRAIYEEKLTLDLLNSEVKKIDNDCHYVAPLLWNTDKIKLPTALSYDNSLRRYLIVEKQALNHDRFDECSQEIQNLLDKNYARELTRDEITNPSDKAYYNPIFFIHPKNKRTRLIWDLAAKVDGKSLNDFLSPGPNLYCNMLKIQFQSRENKYIFKGDIGEMFHQIKIRDEDTDSLRFMFRLNKNDKIRYFKMLVLPFGAKCSPVISQFVKNKIAEESILKYPVASNVIINNCYVDDVVKSVKTLKEVINLTTEIKQILYEGGFNLLKINSNNKTALKAIKCGMTEEQVKNPKLISYEENEKLLGYNINFHTDEISVSPCLSKIPKELLTKSLIPNKKQVLQTLMSIFDPIGFVQFLTAKLKLIYHYMCVNKYDWNDLLEGEYLNLWYKCVDWISQLEDIKIPRKYCDDYRKIARTELWAFGDAGKHIMCGVLYARFLDENNQLINVRLLHAKTFVVPHKQSRTIPELEVSAAQKICEMTKNVIELHLIKFDEIKYFTDSMVVHEWITKGAKKPTIYVKNRLDKINSLTKPEQWTWVPSELMPADMGTKESAMPEMTYNNEWFNPIIFLIPEENWNSIESNMTTNLTNNPNNTFDENDNILDPEKFSKFRSIITSAQVALKWRDVVKINKINKKIVDLQVLKASNPHNRNLKNDLKDLLKEFESKNLDFTNKTQYYAHLEYLVIKKCQYDVYEHEIDTLRKKRKLTKNNSLYKLNPFIDEKGLLRATSRINHSDKNVEIYGYNRIYPIILPNNHRLTALIILKLHENNFHMLENTVITKLLRKYYIANIKTTVRKIIKNECMICKRLNCRPEIPMMGDLPSYRLAFHVPPFTHSIIDLAGPIIVKNLRNRDIKRYIFVYGCLSTRAVHLELIEDLSANSTLLALQCTINIRGAPRRIVTDNGTNFQGAQSILYAAQTSWNKQLLDKGIIIDPIEWDFAPAKAPHQQGAIERMVGLVKTALGKLNISLNRNPIKYNDFELRCILYEIVGMINSRPLTLTPFENSELDYLTPNHFLIGRQNIQTVPIGEIAFKSLSEYWSDMKLFTNTLWKHWLNAYIPSIMMREKWFDKKSPLKVDDIVIVADPSIANSWRLGKIIEIKPGSQDQVRSVTIKLGKNKPMTCKLENLSKNHILKIYTDEAQSVITRPALAVTRLNIN